MADEELIPYTTPTSLLEAVNTCLRVIGEAPVSTLIGGGGSADVESAFQVVQAVNREVQAEGWSFNTEKALPIQPDVNGWIMLPVNTLRLDATDVDRGVDVVMRGNRLYDKTNHTFVFTRAIKVDVVVLLGFDDLPEYARNYITIKASRRFSDDELVSDTVHRFKEADEQTARMALEKADTEDDDTSFADSEFMVRAARLGRPGRTYGR